MNDLFKELFMNNYINNKTTFIPYGYLRNELYPMYDICIDGDLEENENIDNNYISIEYEYDNIYSGTYDIYRSTEECLLNEELLEQIDDVLDSLSEREEVVIRMRFGLVDDRTEYTLEDMARELKLTRERVRQIESSAIKKLKHPKIHKMLKKYIFDIDETIESRNTYKVIEYKEYDLDHVVNFWIDIIKYYNRHIVGNYVSKLAETKIIDDVKIEAISKDIAHRLSKLINADGSVTIDTNDRNNIISIIFRSNYVFLDLLRKDMTMYIVERNRDIVVKIYIEDKKYELNKEKGVREI